MLPMLATSDKSVENLILNTVKDNPDVSAKRVYNSITKAGITVTYHKVFEKMQDMVKKGIMVKNDRLYSVSNVWVERTTRFMYNIENNNLKVNESGFKHVSKIGQAKLLEFESFENFMDFWNEIRTKFVNFREPNKNDVIMWMGNHSIGPLLYSRKRIGVLNKIKNKKIKYYIAIRGKSKIDEHLIKFYKSQGIRNVAAGVKDFSKNSIYIYNDNVIILFSNEVLENIDKLCNSIDDVNNFNNKTEICNLIERKHTVNAILINDKKMSKLYKDMIHSLVYPDKN